MSHSTTLSPGCQQPAPRHQNCIRHKTPNFEGQFKKAVEYSVETTKAGDLSKA
jgi:hypothetical protein